MRHEIEYSYPNLFKTGLDSILAKCEIWKKTADGKERYFSLLLIIGWYGGTGGVRTVWPSPNSKGGLGPSEHGIGESIQHGL